MVGTSGSADWRARRAGDWVTDEGIVDVVLRIREESQSWIGVGDGGGFGLDVVVVDEAD